jgi:hypothetical protein
LPSLIFFTILGFIFALGGWAGVIFLVVFTLPYLGYRWLFFLLLMMAVCGTMLPFLGFLNMRFPSKPPVRMETVIREALMFGIYVDFLAWLQMGRVLTFPISLFILLCLAVLEFFIRIRENSRWNAQEETKHG